jgi:microcystin degradation protein MlrC
MPKRLAIARMSHEGNSFNPVLTGLQAFERHEWVAGEAARAFYRGTRSELGAAVDFLEAHPDWDGTFLRCAAAPPGGPVESALFGDTGTISSTGSRAGPGTGFTCRCTAP